MARTTDNEMALSHETACRHYPRLGPPSKSEVAPDEHLYQKLGLKRLSLTTRNLPWAKSVMPCPSAV